MVQISELTLQDIGTYQVQIGETWRVYTSFKYAVPMDMTVTLRAGAYRRLLGVLNRVEGCRGVTNISLTKTATPTLKEATVDICFRLESEGGIGDGTYGLIAEILETDAEVHIDDCIVVSGNPPAPPSIWEMIPMLILVMVMSMMMNIMKD